MRWFWLGFSAHTFVAMNPEIDEWGLIMAILAVENVVRWAYRRLGHKTLAG